MSKTKKSREMRVSSLRPITVEMLKKNPKRGAEKWGKFINR